MFYAWTAITGHCWSHVSDTKVFAFLWSAYLPICAPNQNMNSLKKKKQNIDCIILGIHQFLLCIILLFLSQLKFYHQSSSINFAGKVFWSCQRGKLITKMKYPKLLALMVESITMNLMVESVVEKCMQALKFKKTKT